MSTFNYPNGTRAATIGSNVRDFKMEGGGITVSAKTIDNATPAYVNWAGATDASATLASGAFAIAAPGVNGATRAAVLLAPHVTPRFPARARATPVPVISTTVSQ